MKFETSFAFASWYTKSLDFTVLKKKLKKILNNLLHNSYEIFDIIHNDKLTADGLVQAA